MKYLKPEHYQRQHKLNMNRKQIITLVVIAAIIALSLWLIFRKPEEKSTLSAGIEISFPLKEGSRGAGVAALQKYLNSRYSANLSIDGIWGPKTSEAVTLYLKRDNVSKDVFYKWELDKLI